MENSQLESSRYYPDPDPDNEKVDSLKSCIQAVKAMAPTSDTPSISISLPAQSEAKEHSTDADAVIATNPVWSDSSR